MSLAEEIAINQFGQGVRSIADQLDAFSQLDEKSKRRWFVQLYCIVCDAKFIEPDIEQVLAECSFDVTDSIYKYLNLDQLATGSKGVLHIPYTTNPPEGSIDKSYTVLLHLFRIDYQRRYALEKGTPGNWRYRDLSDSEITQGILTKHRELVGEVYHTPGFRSEFTTLAKLWYQDKMRYQPGFQESGPDPQIQFDFVTYDDMVAESRDRNKNSFGIMLLRNSLHKAVMIRYKLAADEANRLVLDVLDRYMKDAYNTGLTED